MLTRISFVSSVMTFSSMIEVPLFLFRVVNFSFVVVSLDPPPEVTLMINVSVLLHFYLMIQ